MTAEHWSGSFSTEMFDGHVSVGAVVSRTVTVKEQLAPELVEHVTVVVPVGKNESEVGMQTAPHAPFVVGAEYVTFAPHEGVLVVTSATTSAGHEIVHGSTASMSDTNADEAWKGWYGFAVGKSLDPVAPTT
jgi:hypothetical protein